MWRDALYASLTPEAADVLRGLNAREAEAVEEIRFYLDRPMELVMDGRGVAQPLAMDGAAMDALVAALCGHARYAYEREMAMGYIPLAGGHRAGVCGHLTDDEGGAPHMGGVTSVCLRVARRVEGASAPMRHALLDGGRARRVLLIGPPGCGKTTALRDAAVYLSDEAGLHVAVADERDELFPGGRWRAGGRRIDVMSGADKARMMAQLLRAMAPQVIVTDEIGRRQDADALADIARCGVGLLASAHGAGMEDVARRPMLRRLLDARTFERYIVMGRRGGGWRVYDGAGVELGGGARRAMPPPQAEEGWAWRGMRR